mgnify:CR=1 FL=1
MVELIHDIDPERVALGAKVGVRGSGLCAGGAGGISFAPDKWDEPQPEAAHGGKVGLRGGGVKEGCGCPDVVDEAF